MAWAIFDSKVAIILVNFFQEHRDLSSRNHLSLIHQNISTRHPALSRAAPSSNHIPSSRYVLSPRHVPSTTYLPTSRHELSSRQAPHSRQPPPSKYASHSYNGQRGARAKPEHHGLEHRLRGQRKKEGSYLELDAYSPYMNPGSTQTRKPRDKRAKKKQHGSVPRSEGHRTNDDSYSQPYKYLYQDEYIYLPYTSPDSRLAGPTKEAY